MNAHRILASSVLCVLVAQPLGQAGTLVVPVDVPDLQQALDIAPAGTTILVQGGRWGPLVVTKPVHIVGHPSAFVAGGPGPSGGFRSPITLAGPGSGEVALSRIAVGGGADFFSYESAAAGIQGGGFDRLLVQDCVIDGPQLNLTLGEYPGDRGIDITIPLLLLERCRVEPSRPMEFDCADSGPDGVPAIESTGTVVLLDSRVRGAGGAVFCQLFGCGAGGIDCPDGGEGGPGVVCDVLYRAASRVAGGQGATWIDGETGIDVCCVKADGPAVVARLDVELAGDLSSSGALLAGSTWTLRWNTPGPHALLFAAPGAGTPTLLPAAGVLFLEPTALLSLGVVASPGSRCFVVPNEPDLIGQQVGVQLLDASGQLTRPVFGSVLP
ncbi:MAG: hypothetical protein DRQ55_14210 [Planctomycetota bacterium]|nr:MAG: hypothetical protein DRQ55_14210 [Planctomycetota bacterium]